MSTFPISRIAPKDTRTELNCRSVKAVLLYFQEHYGREALDDFIADTNMALEYLEDVNNWVSYDYWCRLLQALVDYTRNPMAPFEAGAYVTKMNCFGILHTVLTFLGTPRSVYRMGAQYTSRYSKLGPFEVLSMGRTRCTIRVTLDKRFQQDKNNCLTVQGMWSSIPAVWGLPRATVNEEQCAAEGADSCIYEFVWEEDTTNLSGLYGLLVGMMVSLGMFAFFSITSPLCLLPIPFAGFLAGIAVDLRNRLRKAMNTNEHEANALLESIETIEELNNDLQHKVEQRTAELKDALEKLRNSQEQLVQSEKLASVGRLAAGMAHELNNPVGALRNYVQDILEDLDEDSPLRERLKKAEKTTNRCKRIVTDLLTFARQDSNIRLTAVGPVVAEAIAAVSEDAEEANVSIQDLSEQSGLTVQADPLQLKQALTNIMSNAVDASSDNGVIRVRIRQTETRVEIEVADKGHGIKEDVKAKIFDPFFTTKSTGKGMGLGLAITYDLIRRMKGEIRVEDNKGFGAVFIVSLPVAIRRENIN